MYIFSGLVFFYKFKCYLTAFQIKDPKETTEFYTNLTNHIDSFPTDYSRHKILPQLLNAFQFGNAGSSVLPPLFKVILKNGHTILSEC